MFVGLKATWRVPFTPHYVALMWNVIVVYWMELCHLSIYINELDDAVFYISDMLLFQYITLCYYYNTIKYYYNIYGSFIFWIFRVNK